VSAAVGGVAVVPAEAWPDSEAARSDTGAVGFKHGADRNGRLYGVAVIAVPL
jgi:hypothetical protein